MRRVRGPLWLWHSYLLAGHIPNVKLTIYPDAGHGLLFQYPHEFVAEVNAFLTE